jgi:hypothetical protein
MELRRILTGDMARELTVSYRSHNQELFQVSSHNIFHDFPPLSTLHALGGRGGSGKGKGTPHSCF